MTGTELLGVVLLAFQGLAAIELVAGVRRVGVGTACAAALPIGLVAHATIALPLVLAGLSVSLKSAAFQAGLFGLAALAVACFRPRLIRRPSPARWRTAEVTAAGLVVLVLLLLGMTAALEPPVEWDLLAIWGFKAKALGIPGAALERWRDPAFAYAHPDYPLAWPLALAVQPAFAGQEPRGGSGLLGVALLAAAAGFSAALLGPWGRRAALAGAGLLVLLPLAGAQAVRAQADLPLATLFLVAAGALAEWLLREDRAALALGALATAGLMIVKQEGMALAAAVAGVVLWRTRGGARLRVAGTLGAAFLIVDLPWLLLRSTLPAGAANSLLDMTPTRVVAGLSRLPEILASLPVYLGAPADWGAFWPLVGLALAVLAADRGRPRQEADLALFLVVPAPLYLLALLAVDWEPARLAEVTLSRLALQFAPLALLVSIRVAARYGAFGGDRTATEAGSAECDTADGASS